MRRDFDRLITEAEGRPLAGWDFSWLGERMQTEPLPWDFDALVDGRARAAPDLLDLGTGGGEWLSSLPYRPPRTVATEAWPSNVAVAAARLAPLGIDVVQVEPARENVEQAARETSGRLPFPADAFHLIVSRHESYVPAEIARVLVPGGSFLTQQLAPGSDELARLLDTAAPATSTFELDLAVRQLEAAGLEVTDCAEGRQTVTFADVGALAWYLRAIPWALPRFDPDSFRDKLRKLHESDEPLQASLYGFWLEAVHH